MTSDREIVVIGVDGREVRVRWADGAPCDGAGSPAGLLSAGLLARLGVRSAGRWRLRPSGPGRLCLVREATAAARDPRQDRLAAERRRLDRLNEESDWVRVKPIDVLPGSEPERYLVTFVCRGIVGIDGQRQPVYGDRHEVEMLCDEDFPAEPPRLRWNTPIWHPNIQHDGAKGVCINKPEWLGGMGLDDLCRQMFEMAQYKNYHAEYKPPYPLDGAAARWVLEHAEPNGIVDKKRKISVDDRPFTRPTVTDRIRLEVQPPKPQAPRIRLATATPPGNSVAEVAAEVARAPRIRVQPVRSPGPTPSPAAPRIRILPG